MFKYFFSILCLDASAWRDQEVDDEIDFLTWLQSVEEGKRVHVESKVNLNRQRERLSRAREAEVRRLYENCKENAYDYNSQWKTSAGGVRYGHSTFSVAEEEPYKYKPEVLDILSLNLITTDVLKPFNTSALKHIATLNDVCMFVIEKTIFKIVRYKYRVLVV